MKMQRRLALMVLTLLAFTSGTPQTTADDVVPAAMTGAWGGNAHVIVIWCKQTNLQVRLNIQGDGKVTGKIGDATLRNGQFRANRGWLGRKLNIKTDHIVTGDLEGSIVAAENISRRSVSIPLNLKNGIITGGLHTSGTHVGGKKSMVLSAAGLVLKHEGKSH